MFENEMKMMHQRYQKWFNILYHFGCHPDYCEDIIQDMYLKIYLHLKSGKSILYIDGTINYYYIFKVLRSLYFDIKRKEKNISFIDLEILYKMESDSEHTVLYAEIQDELKNMYWYDRKIFEIITEGESIASLSRKTGIRYESLYNTYVKTKNKIKKLL
tara:strand:- start:3558 stop:4034 length:477 start_codon:yes stop_codon:yes gene_type:complete